MVSFHAVVLIIICLAIIERGQLQKNDVITPADEAHILHHHHCGYLAVSSEQQRYLIIGARDYTNIGIGNMLAFFPAAHFFGIVSNRHIVIQDESHFGVFCKVIRCGFPFLSEVMAAYPDYFSKVKFDSFPGLKWRDMLSAIENNTVLYSDQPLISVSGLDSRSEWYIWKNTTRKCISRVTGMIVIISE